MDAVAKHNEAGCVLLPSESPAFQYGSHPSQNKYLPFPNLVLCLLLWFSFFVLLFLFNFLFESRHATLFLSAPTLLRRLHPKAQRLVIFRSIWAGWTAKTLSEAESSWNWAVTNSPLRQRTRDTETSASSAELGTSGSSWWPLLAPTGDQILSSRKVG